MNLKTVDTYLNYKLDENSDFILLTFYELRVKLNLSQTDTNEFINLSAIRLNILQVKNMNIMRNIKL